MHFAVVLRPDLHVQQTHLWSQNHNAFHNGAAHFLYFHWLYRAAQKKCCNLSQFTIKTFVSLNKNCFLNNTKRFKLILNLLIDIIFDNIFYDLFRAAPYSLMLVLNKDALFHWTSCFETRDHKYLLLTYSGAALTTLCFLHNLWMDPTSKCNITLS